ncbi:HTH domain-containing protein, partial [Fusobacterium sp.]|uniref:HTH domain-containing protein n=1 Tax=Fusobacterium sp. TaxID=68766 RepID=UPI0025C1C051
MLNSKGNNILKYLSKNEGKGSIKELAQTLQLSERSIRYELDKIDEYLLREGLEPLKRKFGGKIFFEKYDI